VQPVEPDPPDGGSTLRRVRLDLRLQLADEVGDMPSGRLG
jgi:hypothetical protein